MTAALIATARRSDRDKRNGNLLLTGKMDEKKEDRYMYCTVELEN